MKYEYGERIGRTAKLSVGSSAIIFDGEGKVLLTRRADNLRWCLPSGRMDPGETIEECCVREVWEETGLEVKVTKLLGIYSTPNQINVYGDGNRWQVVGVSFLAERVGGELGLSNETTEVGYFSVDELEALDLIESHRERIADALAEPQTPIIK